MTKANSHVINSNEIKYLIESEVKKQIFENRSFIESEVKKQVFENKCIIESEVKKQVSITRNMIYAFLIGLTFATFIGFSFKDLFLLPIMKHAYPPTAIYADIKTNLSTDRSLLKGEELRNEIKELVWEAMFSGDQSKFIKLTSQNCFYSSLEEKFNLELTNAFGLNKSSVFTVELNENQMLRDAILNKGSEFQRADIRMVAKNMDGDPTSCGPAFRHDKLHAIIRIPETANKSNFCWLRCGGIAAPKYLIEITANGHKVRGIELISIERDGTSENLELKVSKTIAKQLNLPNWKTFRARIIGSYRLTDVYWE